MAFYRFRSDDGSHYGSCEVFHLNPSQAWELMGDSWEVSEQGEHITLEGWYWQACFPGCLPDGEPFGPFQTEEEAMADADAVE